MWRRTRNRYTCLWGQHVTLILHTAIAIFDGFQLPFWLKRIPIHQLTQNLTFNIRFHLYIHDHDFGQTFGTFTYEVKTYVPLKGQIATFDGFRLPFFGSNRYNSTNWLKILVLAFVSTSTFMIMTLNKLSVRLLMRWQHTYPWYWQNATFDAFRLRFFWLKRIPIHQLTQNFSFNIRFHFYIHDRDFGQTFGTLMRWRHTYPWYCRMQHLMLFVYFFLAQTDTNPPTNSFLTFVFTSVIMNVEVKTNVKTELVGGLVSVWAKKSKQKASNVAFCQYQGYVCLHLISVPKVCPKSRSWM